MPYDPTCRTRLLAAIEAETPPRPELRERLFTALQKAGQERGVQLNDLQAAHLVDAALAAIDEQWRPWDQLSPATQESFATFVTEIEREKLASARRRTDPLAREES